MRKTLWRTVSRLGSLGILALFYLAFLPLADAEIIKAENRVNWTPGATVGVQIPIPVRTNLIDVTKPPYNADNMGVMDATAAIQAAINAARSNDVVYLPAGRYTISTAIFVNKSYITVRGAGQNNTFLFTKSGFKIGSDASNYIYNKTDFIASGATKGSSTVTLSNTPTFGAGDMVVLGGTIPPTDLMQVMSLGIPSFEPKYHALCTAVSGNNVTFAAPLLHDFTNAYAVKLNSTTYKGIGIESLSLSGSNSISGAMNTFGFLVQFSMAANCWMTDCTITWAHNYSVFLADSAHLTIRRNTIRFAQGAGSNHAGILTGSSYCLIEDNIIADGLQPGIEFNGGGGNAFFANFFTNNLMDVVNHGPHPLMNLWEANHLGVYPVITAGPTTNYYGGGFLLDGYFGSASHQTLFRNTMTSFFQPIAMKRWSSYCSIVGNVIGRSGFTFTNFMHDINNLAYQCIELGRPNIGNNSYTGVNPPIPWNFPGHFVNGTIPNGCFAFTNNQGPTNVLYGNFTNAPEAFAWVIFQDPVNTNRYWPQDGLDVQKVRATATNLTLSRSITVSNGWRVYFIGQSLECYQQLITTNRATHTISGNYDYYHNAVTWDTNNADHTLPVSLLYTNGAPSWWGTNRWPAIDPVATLKVRPIPAEVRYSAITVIGGDRSAPTAPSSLSAQEVGANQVNLSWTPSTDNVAVAGYFVERSQGIGSTAFNQVGVAFNSSFNDSGLSGSTTYNYRVRATDDAGNLSGFSTAATATTAAPPLDQTAPTVPTSPLAQATGAGSVSISWTASTDNVGVTGYRVERSQGTGSTSFIEIGSPLTVGWSDVGLSPSTVYNYRVRAADAEGNLSGYSPVATATTTSGALDQIPPSNPPSKPGAATVGENGFYLSWAPSTDNVAVTGYLLERSQGAGSVSFNQIATPVGTSYGDGGLSAGTVYNYRLRAVDAAGNVSGYSPVGTGKTSGGQSPAPPQNTRIISQ